MWFLLIYIQLTSIYAQRIALRGSSHPCEGRLEVYHNGQWGLVGHHQWMPVNGKVVCKSLGCGDHVDSGIFHHTYTNLPSLTNFWMDEIQCKGTEKKLWDCTFNGWNITQCLKQNYISVNCSGSVSLRLNLNGITDACAGVIQFKTPNETIRVCSLDRNVDINKVCQELNCGEHNRIITSRTISAEGSSYNVSLSCIGNEDFLWQCMDWVSGKSNTCQDEISIICSNHTHVRLRGSPDVCEGNLEKYSTGGDWVNVPCQENNFNMLDSICVNLMCGRAVDVKPCNESKNTWLKCSDRVKVELTKSGGNASVCYGNIYINLNGSRHAVCPNPTSSFRKTGEVVCREMQCGTALSVLQSSPMQLSHISIECQGHEESLWECIHKPVTVGTCQPIKIICSGSLKMHLINGLDKCGGQLEVKLADSWWSVNHVGWSSQNSDMVCHHLKCGKFKYTNQHRFVRSKSPLLQWKLTCNGINISQCSMAEEKYHQEDSIVNIICNKHELWFLQGDLPCEGRVKNENNEYLQNITNEKATEVCNRNFCGHGNIIPKSENSHMNSFSCPENTTSPVNCSMMNATISTEPDFPFVKCSGSMEVRLQNKCHGKVLVCSDKNCGVCGDTWTEEQSRMLCKVLGCGQAITKKYTGEEKSEVTVASVHCSQKAENFSQCNFVKLHNSSLCQKQAYVSCTGSVKAVLQDPRDKCAGNLKLFYAGALQPLCDSSVNIETQNVICASLGCGKALSFTQSISSTSNSRGLQKLTCKDGSISNCDFSEAKEKQCHVGHLKCTGWRRLLLINDKTACSGNVYLQNQNETHLFAVSNDSWGKLELNELCKYLECGNLSENKATEQLNMPTWSRTYKCTGNPKSIWDCEKEEATMGKHHLHISCTDKPNITLTSLNKRNCTGEVWLKNERMCKSQETESVLNEFCQHLGCSMFFKTWSTKFEGSARYLSCTGKETRLWQCSSWTDKCEGVISLACAKGIQWKLSSHCGGELQVDYRGKWEHACPVENKNDADRICRDLDCGNAKENLDKHVQNTANPDIRIKCEIAHNHLMHCIKTGAANCTQVAVIYCEKYIPPVIINKSRIDTGLIVAIVVGLLLVLVAALIMFWKRNAFLTILRFKTSDEDTDGEISENEMQSLNKQDVFEMGDYDDIVATVDQEDNQSQGSASEHEEENLNTSKGSSGTEYDDVDEENVKQPPGSSPTDPFLPPRPDNILDQVTFEAEVETQEDYDDVISPQTMANEQRESSNIPGPSSNPLILVSNDEVKPQKDE